MEKASTYGLNRTWLSRDPLLSGRLAHFYQQLAGMQRFLATLLHPTNNQQQETVPVYEDLIKQIPLAPTKRAEKLVWIQVKSSALPVREQLNTSGMQGETRCYLFLAVFFVGDNCSPNGTALWTWLSAGDFEKKRLTFGLGCNSYGIFHRM